jgi:hypothetical protein
LNDEIQRALSIDAATPMLDRTIDITTTGRHSGEPRRIEICFYRFENQIYISGIPAPTPRNWERNLAATPAFTFHLKHQVVADLPASATVISDPGERRRIFTAFVEAFNQRQTPDSPWPNAVLEEWVDRSPLVRVSFLDGD